MFEILFLIPAASLRAICICDSFWFVTARARLKLLTVCQGLALLSAEGLVGSGAGGALAITEHSLQEIHVSAENLGEILMGDSIENSLYDVRTCSRIGLSDLGYLSEYWLHGWLWIERQTDLVYKPDLMNLTCQGKLHHDYIRLRLIETYRNHVDCWAGWKSMHPVHFCAIGHCMMRTCFCVGLQPLHYCILLCLHVFWPNWYASSGQSCIQEHDWQRISGTNRREKQKNRPLWAKSAACRWIGWLTICRQSCTWAMEDSHGVTHCGCIPSWNAGVMCSFLRLHAFISEAMKYQKTRTGAMSCLLVFQYNALWVKIVTAWLHSLLRSLLHSLLNSLQSRRYTNGFPVGLKIDGRPGNRQFTVFKKQPVHDCIGPYWPTLWTSDVKCTTLSVTTSTITSRLGSHLRYNPHQSTASRCLQMPRPLDKHGLALDIPWHPLTSLD